MPYACQLRYVAFGVHSVQFFCCFDYVSVVRVVVRKRGETDGKTPEITQFLGRGRAENGNTQRSDDIAGSLSVSRDYSRYFIQISRRKEHSCLQAGQSLAIQKGSAGSLDGKEERVHRTPERWEAKAARKVTAKS